jgi:hypothetical protein
MHRLTMCARAGSAIGLKARSHPSGVRRTSVEEEVIGRGPNVGFGNRSLLWTRLTTVVTASLISAALEAVSGQRALAMKQVNSVLAAICFMRIGVFSSMARRPPRTWLFLGLWRPAGNSECSPKGLPVWSARRCSPTRTRVRYCVQRPMYCEKSL